MTDPDSRRDAASGPKGRRGVRALLDLFRKPAPPGGPAESDASQAQIATNETLVLQARAFQDLRVHDVMKPRADIVAVERGCPFSELVDRFVVAEHSRMPVYRDTLDEPVGVVHVKDVFRLMARKTRRPKPEDQLLQGRHNLVRKVLYVPPFMRASELMSMMRARRSHMALVIDEFGGVDGLVTLEDLLEALVGDIADEHDEDGDGVAPIAEDKHGWLVDGRQPLDDLEAVLSLGVLSPPDLDEEIDTVAGLLNTLAGHVPQRGEKIEHASGLVFEVMSADPRRVKRVRIRPAPTPIAHSILDEPTGK
ncbi:hemolysin family protein [Phenylobacterium immobile]|uniref:hemolysin family protein n=1 Tax=Phenylobacterium immobile TaxID=21 RepID=UPI000AAEAB95|nr:hemolysin family protein [Phenylobacterium immobile]